MPHMMPMMWIVSYLFTLLFLFIIISLLYFFHIPMLPPSSKLKKKLHKWTWLW